VIVRADEVSNETSSPKVLAFGCECCGMARSMSFRAMLIIILLFGVSALMSAFTLGMRMANHTLFTGSTVLTVVNVAIPLVGVATYFAMALLKAKQGRVRASY
jgi:hypothetical protein